MLTKLSCSGAGSRRSRPLLDDRGPSLEFGVDTVVFSSDVRVLGVALSSDLTMDKHVSKVCSATATCPAITGFRVSGDAGPCLC